MATTEIPPFQPLVENSEERIDEILYEALYKSGHLKINIQMYYITVTRGMYFTFHIRLSRYTYGYVLFY